MSFSNDDRMCPMYFLSNLEFRNFPIILSSRNVAGNDIRIVKRRSFSYILRNVPETSNFLTIYLFLFHRKTVVIFAMKMQIIGNSFDLNPQK